jgi:hypothetical protein
MMVTNTTNVLLMVTDIYPMVTNVYPIVVLPTLKKLQKLIKKSENQKKMGWQPCFCQ